MTSQSQLLPRRLSTLETWGFGFTVLLFWLLVAPEVHLLLGPGAIWVWGPATLAGVVVILQIRRLALHRPEAAGGSPVYVAALWRDHPLIGRWAGLAYFHSWAIVPAALSWLLADFAVTNLAALGLELPTWPIQLTLLGAIYLTAFSGVRVLSVVHLCFVLPSLGLLLLFAVHGLVQTLATGAATASGIAWTLPDAGRWLAAFFLIVYTTYGIETAAAFTADSRNPGATLNCLLAAALLLPVVMVGGSLFLAAAGPTIAADPAAGAVLESVGWRLWGEFTPFGVTFMLASSMVLACATAVAVAPRVVWQLSRDGLLTPLLGALGPDGVPRRAVALAMLLALGHLWMGVGDMLLLGGASWLGFWCVMHVGLWIQRREHHVLWPHLALALACLEASALLVGGYLLGGHLVILGLAIPLGLALIDRIACSWQWAAPPRPLRSRWRGGCSQSVEIALMVGLILLTVTAGWQVGRLVGPDMSAAAGRLSIILLLVTAFLGIAWAAWTHLRRSEQLEQARDDFQDVVIGTPEAMLVVDGEGRVRLANPAAEQLLQCAENALLGRRLTTLLPDLAGEPPDWSSFREYELTWGSTPRTIELAARHVPSSERDEFTVTLRDLTARKAAENALRTSEQRLQAALDASRSLVWDLDPISGQLQRQIGQFDLLGYRSEPGPMSADQWQSVIHHDDLSEVLRRQEAHFCGSEPIYESEHRLRTRSGEWLWVLDRGRVVARDEQGRATRLIGSTTDISERKELELQLAQAQKMEAVGHLAGGVAHDFNNVLTAILTTIELLLEDESRLQEDQRADLVEIRGAAMRAAQITSQLLAFGRRQQLRPRPVDLNEAVAHTATLLRRLIGEHIALETTSSAEPAMVRADPVQLEQAILNLALNARDAMADGGTLALSIQSREVTAETTADGETIRAGPAWSVVVSDTGTGMNEEIRSHLFEPFFTTKAVGQGAGLGLAMVYGFVRQSGGTVLVDSQPGQGSRFELCFPRVARTAAAPAVEAPPSTARGSETILLVEDEAAVRNLLQRILESQGYEVVAAENGKLALSIAESQPPDRFQLVISDLVMPELGGEELARQLRRQRPELEFLFISGYPSAPRASEQPSAAPPFPQKPFPPAARLAEVRRLLDARARRDDAGHPDIDSSGRPATGQAATGLDAASRLPRSRGRLDRLSE